MKQLIFPLLCALLVFSLVLQSSCNPDDYGPCEEDPFLIPERAYLSIEIYKTGEVDQTSLLDVIQYPCDRDSVSAFDEAGTIVDEFDFRSNGYISFRATYPDQLNQTALSQEVSRKFLLYINYLTIHEVEIKYKLREVNCRYDLFEYIEVFYDDELYARTEDVVKNSTNSS